METRKVQVTGGSTYTVSIPKDWAESNDVSAGSIVEFYPQDESLVLTPEEKRGRRAGELEVVETTPEYIQRAVVAMYLNGYDEVVFDVSALETHQRRVVKEAASELIGLEVITETRSEIRMRNLLDSGELSVRDSVVRMRMKAREMLTDAVTGLLENDPDRIEAVVLREDDLDRLWYLISRVFRRVLRDPAAVNEVELDRETCFDYRSTARQLERIGDHAVKIADNADAIDSVPPAVGDDLDALRSEVCSLVDGAVAAVVSADPDTAVQQANEIRDRAADCQTTVRQIERELLDLDAERAHRLSLVVDSLSRSADYGGNVAETALQRATPSHEPTESAIPS